MAIAADWKSADLKYGLKGSSPLLSAKISWCSIMEMQHPHKVSKAGSIPTTTTKEFDTWLKGEALVS